VLTNLHTLGVINGSGRTQGAKKTHPVAQARVSGINSRNHKELRDVVSGHGHLESLSIWLDKDTQVIDPCLENDDFKPPEKLGKLKLHGHEQVDKLTEWMRALIMLDL
jgi:hypothetical protein